MINEAQSDQSVHIQQIHHGKFAKISSTSLLLMVGAFGPALKAGRPVTGSVTIFILCGRFLRGVSTIRPFSIFASRGSPGRISSRRRSGPGRTTCPLVDTLVCMVRRSYPNGRSFATKLAFAPLIGLYSDNEIAVLIRETRADKLQEISTWQVRHLHYDSNTGWLKHRSGMPRSTSSNGCQ